MPVWFAKCVLRMHYIHDREIDINNARHLSREIGQVSQGGGNTGYTHSQHISAHSTIKCCVLYTCVPSGLYPDFFLLYMPTDFTGYYSHVANLSSKDHLPPNAKSPFISTPLVSMNVPVVDFLIYHVTYREFPDLHCLDAIWTQCPGSVTWSGKVHCAMRMPGGRSAKCSHQFISTQCHIYGDNRAINYTTCVL